MSILAALEGNAGVAIGNVVGSNIFNITFVVGLTAFLNPLKVESTTIRKEIPFTLLGSIVLLVLISDIALQSGQTANLITRSDGLIFLLFFAIFMYYIFEVARNNREQNPGEDSGKDKSKLGRNSLFTIGGLAAIIFGGDLVVDNATEIAYSFGMSHTLVGCLLYTSPSPRDRQKSRMPSSA